MTAIEQGTAKMYPVMAAVANWLEHKRACAICKHVPRRWHAYCLEGNVLFERLRDEEARR